MVSTTPVFPIVPTAQQYDWGKRAPNSKVAQFVQNHSDLYAKSYQAAGINLDDKKPYAELWMGTHPTSPSRLLDGTTLSSHLAANPSLIGDDAVVEFSAEDGNIPFLFKILAIEKALSIQTHPDKATAEKLHAEQPNIYKDSNHKPEMAIALTPFAALCGFRPLPQIAAFLDATPELAALVPSALHSFRTTVSSRPSPEAEISVLRELFGALMTAPEERFKEELRKLIQRYKEGNVKKDEEEVRELVLRLESQFPGDIGVFCAFVLNYMQLQPGEAIFLGAGEPHAYVSGDIVETMATSDNVIRAGLTPKLRDVPNLISGLTYNASLPTKHVVEPTPFPPSSSSSSTQLTPADDDVNQDPFADPVPPEEKKAESKLYDPPVPEFSVVRVQVSSSSTEGTDGESHKPLRGPSILIATRGQGKILWAESGPNGTGAKVERFVELKDGSVVFVGAGTGVKFVADNGELEVYRAFVEPRV